MFPGEKITSEQSSLVWYRPQSQPLIVEVAVIYDIRLSCSLSSVGIKGTDTGRGGVHPTFIYVYVHRNTGEGSGQSGGVTDWVREFICIFTSFAIVVLSLCDREKGISQSIKCSFSLFLSIFVNILWHSLTYNSKFLKGRVETNFVSVLYQHCLKMITSEGK